MSALAVAALRETANDDKALVVDTDALIESRARDLFSLAAQVDRATTALSEAKKAFLTEFGEGARVEIPGLGTVVVTQTTFDRLGETAETEFDLAAFLAAPLKLRTELEKLGIVKMVQKKIKGVAAQVRLTPVKKGK